MVRAVPFHYTGKVWCLRVPTGAFVAVRNGVAFPTGNSGFPKSLDASKAIDQHLGFEREVTREATAPAIRGDVIGFDQRASTDRERRDKPVSPQAVQWDGWGTALKPAYEPIVVARKPLHGNVAQNVLAFGTGAINIDGCRVGMGETTPSGAPGRWPANVIHDGSDDVMVAFPDAPGALAPVTGNEPSASTLGVFGDYTARALSTPREVRPSTTATSFRPQPGQKHYTPRRSAGGRNQAVWKGTGMFAADATNNGVRSFGDDGSAARFFYSAKASQQDRNEGLAVRGNHPTVKPTDLMRYLCKLVTQPNGLVLDPFCGSGSTGKAAMFEGFRFAGMDLDESHIALSRARMLWALKELVVRDPFGFGD